VATPGAESAVLTALLSWQSLSVHLMHGRFQVVSEGRLRRCSPQEEEEEEEE